MTMVGEVTAAIKAFRELLAATKEVWEAVKDGKKFLLQFYPEAYPHLKDLLDEMSKTLNGVSNILAVIIGFQFTVEGPDRAREPARFNEQVLAKEREVNTLRQNKSALHASCEKIKKDLDDLDKLAGERWSGWAVLFHVQRKQRREEISSKLRMYYADDRYIVERIGFLMTALDRAFEDIRATLGAGSTSQQSPENVPAAAEKLAEYQAAFKPLRDDCITLVDDFRGAISSM